MANELEPRSMGEGNHLSTSAEAQLNTFRARLDEEKPSATKIIPGFLFRNGRERQVGFTRKLGAFPSTLHWIYTDGIHYDPGPKVDDDLLRQHTETYRRGLEARDQLLDRINAIQILGMVRDVWGRGEIQQKGREALLWCDYAVAEEEIKALHVPGHYVSGSAVNGDSYVASSTLYEITGMWFNSRKRAQEEIRVDFGNMQFPDPENLDGRELREYFLDGYSPIPNKIWTRPDNLVIRVTVPYSMQRVRVVGGYKSDSKGFAWFDQSVSQQEIMDYLSEKLEALRIAGQLPLQVEELELAKIEELSKRGLLKKERSH